MAGGKKSRKHGRNSRRPTEASSPNTRYKRQGRREKNKAAKLRKHLRAHPLNRSAKAALKKVA